MADNIWCPETHKHLITIDHGLVLNVANLRTIGEVRRGSIYNLAGGLLCHLEDLQAGYDSKRAIPDALRLAIDGPCSAVGFQSSEPSGAATDVVNMVVSAVVHEEGYKPSSRDNAIDKHKRSKKEQ